MFQPITLQMLSIINLLTNLLITSHLQYTVISISLYRQILLFQLMNLLKVANHNTNKTYPKSTKTEMGVQSLMEAFASKDILLCCSNNITIVKTAKTKDPKRIPTLRSLFAKKQTFKFYAGQQHNALQLVMDQYEKNNHRDYIFSAISSNLPNQKKQTRNLSNKLIPKPQLPTNFNPHHFSSANPTKELKTQRKEVKTQRKIIKTQRKEVNTQPKEGFVNKQNILMNNNRHYQTEVPQRHSQFTAIHTKELNIIDKEEEEPRFSFANYIREAEVQKKQTELLQNAKVPAQYFSRKEEKGGESKKQEKDKENDLRLMEMSSIAEKQYRANNQKEAEMDSLRVDIDKINEICSKEEIEKPQRSIEELPLHLQPKSIQKVQLAQIVKDRERKQECAQITLSKESQEGNSEYQVRYNLSFLEKDQRKTEVYRISPIKFRKKSEVLTELVKQKLVDKQSDSIMIL